MKKVFILVLCSFIASLNLVAQTKAGKVDNTQHTTLYSCAKHPEVTSHKAGKCSKCGMELRLNKKEEMASISKNYTCPVHTEVASHDPGKCPKCGKKLNLSVKEQMKSEVTKVYTCPMHPDVALDKEGVCSKCGTMLVKKKKVK